MGFVILASKGNMTIYTDESRRSTAPKGVTLELFFLESGIAVFTDEGNHVVEYQ